MRVNKRDVSLFLSFLAASHILSSFPLSVLKAIHLGSLTTCRQDAARRLIGRVRGDTPPRTFCAESVRAGRRGGGILQVSQRRTLL